MFAEFYRYLILNYRLTLPGIGQFALERKPAQADFINKQLHPPTYAISMQQDTESPSISFFKWLSGALAISEREAIIKFNDFLYDVKKQIEDGAVVKWNNVGVLKSSLGGQVKFTPVSSPDQELAVVAEKIIRERASHFVRVGEKEKTSEEMHEMLQVVASKKSRWWVAPLILCIITLAFIAWYFINNGFEATTVGNSKLFLP